MIGEKRVSALSDSHPGGSDWRSTRRCSRVHCIAALEHFDPSLEQLVSWPSSSRPRLSPRLGSSRSSPIDGRVVVVVRSFTCSTFCVVSLVRWALQKRCVQRRRVRTWSGRFTRRVAACVNDCRNVEWFSSPKQLTFSNVPTSKVNDAHWARVSPPCSSYRV